MNYDEAIKTFHTMHPEYDTANIGTYCLHDIILDALKTAKKEHAELSAIKQRAEEKNGELMQWVNIDSIDNFFIFSNNKRIHPEVIKNYQNTISIINYIIKGEGK